MATLEIKQQLVVEVEEDANSFEEQRGAAVLQPRRGAAWSGVGRPSVERCGSKHHQDQGNKELQRHRRLEVLGQIFLKW